MVALLSLVVACPDGSPLPDSLRPFRTQAVSSHPDAGLWDECSRLVAAAAIGASAVGRAAGLNPATGGIVLASRTASLPSMHAFFDRVVKRGPRLASPLKFSHTGLNTPAGIAALETGLQGPNLTVDSGALALTTAIDLLHENQATWVLAGAAESYGDLAPELAGALGRDRPPFDFAVFAVLSRMAATDGNWLGEIVDSRMGSADQLLQHANPDRVHRAATLIDALPIPSETAHPTVLIGEAGRTCALITVRLARGWRGKA